MKTCHTCKITKDYTEFSKSKSRKDGHQYQCKVCRKQYQINNVDKLRQYIKQWSIDNAEHKRQYSKQFIKDNAEHIIQYKKQYYIDNIITITQNAIVYRQTEKGKLADKVSKHKRRALLKANTPVDKHFTTDDIILKLKLQHDKCVYCQTSIKKYYEIDHIIPVSKGGSNESSNIQLLCKKCNGTGGKWNKLPHEFAQQHGKLF